MPNPLTWIRHSLHRYPNPIPHPPIKPRNTDPVSQDNGHKANPSSDRQERAGQITGAVGFATLPNGNTAGKKPIKVAAPTSAVLARDNPLETKGPQASRAEALRTPRRL